MLFVSQHCYCRESSLYGLYRLLEMFISKGCILFRNATSPSSSPPPLLPLLVELMLSLSPREAHFVRCVVVIFSVIGTCLDGREACTSYHVMRMTASCRCSNHLVFVLLRYLTVLQQPSLLKVSAYSADMIESKHISQRWLSVRLFDGAIE